MTVLVMLGNYFQAGIEFLGNLPVASILDLASFGSMFAIRTDNGCARAGVRFFEFPPSTKTTPQSPTAVIDIPTPSQMARPLPIASTTFDAADLMPQSSSGALTSLMILVVLWLFCLFALALTYKPVQVAVRTWITNLCHRVAQTTCLVSRNIAHVTSFAAFKLARIYDVVLNSLVNAISTQASHTRRILNITTLVCYSQIKTSTAFVLEHQPVLASFGSVAAFANIIQQLSFFCDIPILYTDILLVIAAAPSIAASCILSAVLLGLIKPASSTLPPVVVARRAGFVAGMRVSTRGGVLARITPKDHTGGALHDIHGAYQQILLKRDQTRAARSCAKHVKMLTVLITLLALGLSFFLVLYGLSAEDFKFENHFKIGAVNAARSRNVLPLTLNWTWGLVPGFRSPTNDFDIPSSIYNLILSPFIVQSEPVVDLGSLVEHSTRNNTHR